MKKNWVERFTGLTLAINPIFTLFGVICLSLRSKKGLWTKIKEDRISLTFWVLLALSGVISVIFSVDKPDAIANYFLPFAFIWLYILGRWFIKDPETFIQNLIRGVAVLALIAVLAKTFNWSLSIGQIRILGRFAARGRGEILYIADNGLGLLFQAGIVGGIASILGYWQEKKYFLENLVAVLLCSGGLIISASRGAMMGVLVGLAFLIVKYWIAAVIGGLFVGGLLIVGQRFRSIFKLDNHSVRLQIWQSSLKIIKDYPLFGVGPGNFGEIYAKYQPDSLKGNVTCAHSNYLNIFIGWGIIGGILFWGWHLFIFGRAIFKGLTPLQRIIMAILISYFAHVTINELFAAYSGFLLGLLDHPSFQKSQQVKEA